MIETWNCGICMKERPDRFIGVVTYPLDIAGFPKAERNLKFCNDNPECHRQAILKSKTRKI